MLLSVLVLGITGGEVVVDSQMLAFFFSSLYKLYLRSFLYLLPNP